MSIKELKMIALLIAGNRNGEKFLKAEVVKDKKAFESFETYWKLKVSYQYPDFRCVLFDESQFSNSQWNTLLQLTKEFK